MNKRFKACDLIVLIKPCLSFSQTSLVILIIFREDFINPK